MKKICYISALLGIEKRGIESYSLGLLKNLNQINKNLEFTIVSGGLVTESFAHKNYIFPIKPKVLKGIWGSNWFNDHLAIFALSPSNLYQLICSLSIIKFLVKNKFDFYIPTNYFELFVCKLAKKIKKEKSKIIFVGHAGPGHDDFKALLLKPEVFVELTKPSFDWAYKNAKGKTKVVLIPVGIDTEKFNFDSVKPAVNPFKNKNSIGLFIGAFVPYKRPELSIKMLKKKENLNLIMIGQGPLLDVLRSKYQTLVDAGRLYFTGSIDHTAVPSYVKLADISFMTSTSNENSPSVIMEAMTMKKPVVATDYDRTRWIIEDGGILINPEDVNEFISAIDACLKSYSKYSEQAFQRSKYFSWKNVALMWDVLFS